VREGFLNNVYFWEKVAGHITLILVGEIESLRQKLQNTTLQKVFETRYPPLKDVRSFKRPPTM